MTRVEAALAAAKPSRSVRRDIIIEFLVKVSSVELWTLDGRSERSDRVRKKRRRAKLGLHELFSCKKRGQTMHCSQVSLNMPDFL